MKYTTVGVDIAKNVFQLHWVDGESRSLPHWHGGLWRSPSLGAPIDRNGTRGQIDAGEVR